MRWHQSQPQILERQSRKVQMKGPQNRKEFCQAIRMTWHLVIAQYHLGPNSELPTDLPQAWKQRKYWSLPQSSWLVTLACDWTFLLILNITRAQQRHLETAACRLLTLSKSNVNILETWKPVRILQKNQAEVKKAHCDFSYLNESGTCLHISNWSFSSPSVQPLNIVTSQRSALNLPFYPLYILLP